MGLVEARGGSVELDATGGAAARLVLHEEPNEAQDDGCAEEEGEGDPAGSRNLPLNNRSPCCATKRTAKTKVSTTFKLRRRDLIWLIICRLVGWDFEKFATARTGGDAVALAWCRADRG